MLFHYYSNQLIIQMLIRRESKANLICFRLKFFIHLSDSSDSMPTISIRWFTSISRPLLQPHYHPLLFINPTSPEIMKLRYVLTHWFNYVQKSINSLKRFHFAICYLLEIYPHEL